MAHSIEPLPDSVAAAVAASRSGNQVSFWALYEDKGAGTFKLDDFEGLQLAHRLQAREGTNYLVTYWLSRDHWAAHDQQFRRAAQAEQLALDGRASSLEMRPKPIWKRLRIHTLVLALAAFIGALDAIGNHYEWLFSRPFVFLDLKESSGVDFVAGRDFSAALSISNQTRIEHKDLSIAAVLTPREGGSPIRLASSPESVAALSPGSSVEVELSGKAPESGRYNLQVTATGKAGIIAPRRDFNLVYPLHIWPMMPTVDWELRQQGITFARIEAILSLGSEAPHGVDCLVYIYPRRSKGKPILNFFDATAKNWTQDIYTLGEERESLSWHGPVTPFKEKSFSCLIPITQAEDLDVLRKRIKVACSKAEGG